MRPRLTFLSDPLTVLEIGQMDLLSHLLEQTQLRGVVFCQTSARPPWGIAMGARPEAMFHVVTDGACHLLTAKGKPRQLAAGDIVLFPRGDRHGLADDPKRPLVPLEKWLASGAYRPHGDSTLGSQLGIRTRVLCGAFDLGMAGASHPVLRLLPSLVHLPGDETRRRPDLSATIASLAREHEADRAGAPLVMSRLLDVLLVQLLRSWAETQPSGGAGVLAALRDSVLARALAAIHDDLARAWSIDSLAREAGTSRATLGRRFEQEVGESPVAYLARARMAEAARRLRTSDEGLAAIAQEVGYTSEFAFNRAFRRTHGEPPGSYRARRVVTRHMTVQADV